jgi:hypothetical protein
MERFKVVSALSYVELVQALNALGRNSLFSTVIYFGPADAVGVMAVLDFSYQPVITYEDIVARSQPQIESDVDEFDDENDITLSA